MRRSTEQLWSPESGLPFSTHHHRTFLAELKHDVNIELIVEETVKADNIYMIERFVNLNFLRHLLLLIVLHHQLLRHNLAGVGLVCRDIDDFVALRKASLDSHGEDRTGEGNGYE